MVTTTAKILSVYDIVNAKRLVIDKAALAIIEGGVRVMTAYDIIKRPIITEQSMADTEMKRYTFEVAKNANKIEIAKAVEEIFGVKVAKVNTLNMQGKMKRMGARPAGRRPQLEEGHGHP